MGSLTVVALLPQDKFSPPMSVGAADARARSSSLSEQLHTLELVRQAPETVPPRSALSDQLGNVNVSRSGSFSSPPQALLTSRPEAYSMIQSHLQDAVRSIGNAVPFSVHQHLDTNKEGTKRAHVVTSDSALQTVSDGSAQFQDGKFPPANDNVARGLRQPMPLQMPQPLATQFPPAPLNTPAAPKADPSRVSAGYQASAPDTVAQVSLFPSQQIGASVQHAQAINGEPPSFLPEFTPSMAGLQFNRVASSQEASLTFQQGIMSPPQSVADSMQPLSAQVCQPTNVTSMNTKVRNVAIRSFAVTCKNPTSALTFLLQPCRIQGCDELTVSRRPYCMKHSGNRLCEHAGCTKCAQGSTRFCIAHGGGRRCTHPGCDKGARDKYFCAA